MKAHCYYCDKALYKMFLERGVYKHVDDTETHHNSDGIQICERCKVRLTPRHTAFNCEHCDTPVYRLRQDQFRDKKIERKHLEGIAPQPDPYPNAFLRCRHCRKEITAWE